MRHCILLIVLFFTAVAHDLPADLTVNAMVKPSPGRLQLLLRVPLKAIRDVDFPEGDHGYLDTKRMAPLLPDVARVWLAGSVDVYEAGSRVGPPRIAATQISIESDRSFAGFESALKHTTAPLPDSTENLVWSQVFLDVLLEYPMAGAGAAVSVRPRFDHLAGRVITTLRFLPPGGSVRAFEFTSDPGLIPLDPSWTQAASRFITLGFQHILDGTDHLLFLLCLVIPFRRFRPLLLVVTAFTVAHSITLMAAAYQLGPDALWFPPLIEMLIAASIVYMALENILGASALRRRWMLSFAFGLVHGFGFSFGLQNTLQFTGSHLLASLVSFNVGVELGQILVLGVFVGLLEPLFRFAVKERPGVIVISALVAHTALHWTTERWERLRKFEIGIDFTRLLLPLLLLLTLATLVFFLLRVRGRSTVQPTPSGLSMLAGTRHNLLMKATEWEFRNRALFLGLIFGLTFPLYVFDPHNAGVAIASLIAPALGMTTHLASRSVFFAAAALLVAAAFLRTWASSYLRADVVYAAGVKTDSLVADGPYRRVRNPLYLGNLLMVAGLGVMMNRIGFPLAILATVVFCYRLILREEAELSAMQGKPYFAYRAAVPRLWPSALPRVASAGGEPRWVEGFKAECWCWGFAAAVLAFAATLSLTAFYSILAASVVWLWVSSMSSGRAVKSTTERKAASV